MNSAVSDPLALLRTHLEFERDRENLRHLRLSKAGVEALRRLTASATPGKPQARSISATDRALAPTPSRSETPAPRVTPPLTRPAPAPVEKAPAAVRKPVVTPVDIRLSAEEANSSKAEQLRYLAERAAVCVKCSSLAARRHQVVFGGGNPEADLVFVGEAPGEEEDLQGEPFVGPPGQLLTKMIAAMGLTRQQVYITTLVKCRPDMPPSSTGNRKPTGQEMETCVPYLHAQLDVIKPKVIIALGATAVEGLLNVATPIGSLRGKFQDYRGIPVMPTYLTTCPK